MTVTALVTIEDVHQHLNIPDTDMSHDVELQGFIDAATAFITYVAGDVIATDYAETYETWRTDVIMLRHVPVLTVTSVIEYIGVMAYTLTSQPPGQTVDNYGYSLDFPDAGLLVRRSGVGTRTQFLGSPVVVNYTAGRATVPGDVRMATLEDIRGLYQLTQLGRRPAFGSTSANPSEDWRVGPLNLFPRLAALFDGPGRAQSIA
jgi:hypothetical protein